MRINCPFFAHLENKIILINACGEFHKLSLSLNSRLSIASQPASQAPRVKLLHAFRGRPFLPRTYFICGSTLIAFSLSLSLYFFLINLHGRTKSELRLPPSTQSLKTPQRTGKKVRRRLDPALNPSADGFAARTDSFHEYL